MKSIFIFLLLVGTITQVIDGDTFVVDGQKVRLIGVDCPEIHWNKRARQQNLKDVIFWGLKAKAFVDSLLPPGSKVKLEFDVQRKDKYNRLLVYVWLEDGRLLNELLVENGLAWTLTIPPNVKYSERLYNALLRAKTNRKGFWNILN